MQKLNANRMLFKVLGIVIIFLIGWIWHNLYDYLGHNPIIGLIAPVNESSWEHWKITIFPWIIMMLLEYPFVKNQVTNFTFSKVIGLLVFQFITFGFIYVYHLLGGESGLALHLIMYAIGIIVGHLVSDYLMYNMQRSKWLDNLGLLILIAELILIFTFTLKPPHLDYFKDSMTGTYGIYQYK